MSHIFLLIGNHQFPSLEKLIQNQQLKNVDVKKKFRHLQQCSEPLNSSA